MRSDQTKPHIALRGQWWECASCVNLIGPSSRGPSLPFWYVGQGTTPAEAYENWKKVKHGT